MKCQNRNRSIQFPGCRRQPNLALVVYLAKRLAGKNVSEMTYFVSAGT